MSSLPQKLADVAVVIPTVLRPSLLRAARSVFSQKDAGSIHLLIGVDARKGDEGMLETIRAECPPHVALTIFDPGYSTSKRHGGYYANAFSGSLRTILSYAANAPYVAYLDDDDWWDPSHLASLLTAIQGKGWAFSYRWFTDPETGWTICKDEWDSLGPGKGINNKRFGGFVCPSALMLNKDSCHFLFPLWALSPYPDGTGEDRMVFQELLRQPLWGASGQYTCYYEIAAQEQAAPHHANEFAARGLDWVRDRSLIPAMREKRSGASAV